MDAQNVVLMTGITSGMGEAIAKLSSERIYRVFGTTRRSIGGRAGLDNIELVQLDICDGESARRGVGPRTERQCFDEYVAEGTFRL